MSIAVQIIIVIGILTTGILALIILMIQNKRLKAVLIKNQQQEIDQLKRMIRLTLEAQEEERKLVAKQLHDEVGLMWQALNLTLANAGEGQQKTLQPLVDEITETIRRISWNLMPSSLERFGLLETLDELCHRQEKQYSIPIKLEVSGEKLTLDKNRELVLYRIVQQALDNALVHSSCTSISVSVRQFEAHVTVRVADNGIGFDFPDPRKRTPNFYSFGLYGMECRASLLGGLLQYEKNNPTGTIIIIQIPVHGSL